MKQFIFFLLVVPILVQGQEILIKQPRGVTLGYSATSGITILDVDGLKFKDLNKNGKLDPYEDWRLPIDRRAKDLAKQLTIQEIAGLMLYSAHQSIPARPDGYFAGTYKGKGFDPKVNAASELTDQQKKFLKDDNLRHVLLTTVSSPEDAAKWTNNVQAFCEAMGKGIPANNSSDPRHATQARAEFNAAAGGLISMWPGSLGMAATFDPRMNLVFGHIAAAEYRALGITTALSPQVDIASEPRWSRFEGTFGESSALSAEMGKAYVEGFQSYTWNSQSVNTMVKHWPGGGSGEAGRDAHYANGKFAVYPGNNFEEHFIPFTQGAFKLNGSTKKASAVMPYYTISWNQDTKNGEQVANNYNKYIINDLLRTKYGYDGVVCTDWLVTGDHKAMDVFVDGKSWGVESLSLAERHYKVLMAGVDQFGGNNDMKPILDAYKVGIKEHGEAFMRLRFEQSAVRLLRNIFQVGLFENPYVNPANTKATVGKAEFMKAGFDAQLKSVVLLKNKNHVLPMVSKKTIYIPKRFIPASRHFLGFPLPESNDYPINMQVVGKYFNVTDNPDQADLALVCIESPKSGMGYDPADLAKGGNGYLPISLQYNPYTAVDARDTSIAGGDPMEKFTNRGYKGKTNTAANIHDLKLVEETVQKMKGKPVIVSLNVANPMVFAEFEKSVDVILASFGVQDQAILEILAGKFEPRALLPMQMPASMKTVELQKEDLAFDMECHVDSEGNKYDFGYGLNWKGVIVDERTRKFFKMKNEK